MSAIRVLLTRRWPARVEDRMRKLMANEPDKYSFRFNEKDRPMSEEELREAFRQYDVIAPTVSDRIAASTMTSSSSAPSAPVTKLLANFGVGFSHIDVAKAKEIGVAITNTPGVLTDCTADLAITLMLMTARRASEGERLVRSKKWEGWSPTSFVDSSDVTNATVGVIGMGRIGQAFARRCHYGFNMKVLYYKRSAAPEGVDKYAQRVNSLEEMLPQCDFVSIHTPGGSDARHIINRQNIKLFKPSAILINTARGECVDSDCLIQALQTGVIKGAGLDVYENEPAIHKGFYDLDNVVLLPHLGSATIATREAMGNMALENIIAFVNKQPLINPVK